MYIFICYYSSLSAELQSSISNHSILYNRMFSLYCIIPDRLRQSGRKDDPALHAAGLASHAHPELWAWHPKVDHRTIEAVNEKRACENVSEARYGYVIEPIYA